MLPSRIRQHCRKENILVVVAALSLILLVLQLADYDDSSITEAIRKASHSLGPDKLLSGAGSGAFIEQEELPFHQKVLLPAGFKFDLKVLRRHLWNTASKDWPLEQRRRRIQQAPGKSKSRFVPHEPVNLYHAAKDLPKEQCDTLLNSTMDGLEVNSRRTLPVNFTSIMLIFLEEHDHYKDPYYQEISPFFMKSLRVAMKKDLLPAFWYRLSGSSVWLSDHNVHLVVLRLLFSELKTRNNPTVSFILAQVFDKDWKELKDVRIVFPTNHQEDPNAPGFEANGQRFNSYRFPRLMPVPFAVEGRNPGSRFLGSEDPRIILIKNPKGYEEPMIAFNAKHFKMVPDKEDKLKENRKDFRTMFVARLFQLQKGKGGVDTDVHPLSNDMWYVRTDELRVKGVDRPGKAKNWTPMISEVDRERSGGFDRSVIFVTQLGNLGVIKCDLIDHPGECSIEYSRKGGVGDMRGGLPLLSVNFLLEKSDIPTSQLLPPGREVFVGFARAHLMHCGCGNSFYRPNLLVITKDEVNTTVKDELITKSVYKVSHISGFLSLHVPIDPWQIDRPFAMCHGVNALIPNGVSDWLMSSLDKVDGRWVADDKLSIAFSVSDFSVDRVEIKGILTTLLNVPDKSLFLSPPGTYQVDMSAFLPELDEEGNLAKSVVGHTNTNLECALRDGRRFCKKFGESELLIEDEYSYHDTSKYQEAFEKKVKEYEEAMKEAPNEEGPFY